MICDYCGNLLSNKWEYCPYCGKKIGGQNEGDEFDYLFKGGISGFSIRITSIEGEEPRVRVKKFEPVRVPIENLEEGSEEEGFHPIPQKVLEPEGRAQQIGGHTLLRVLLPGVRESEINVRKLAESIEIRAYKGEKAYFKQFEVPQTARIISQHMKGDELIIEVG